MRTTLDIDDDVLEAARELAQARHETIGKVVSDLARKAFIERPRFKTRNGIPLFPVRPDSGIVTAESVKRLMDESP